MAPPLGDWTAGLQALVSRGVLPALPPLHELRAAAEAALRTRDAECLAAATAAAAAPPGSSSSGGSLLLFPAGELHAALLACLQRHGGIPAAVLPAAALLVTSAAMESYTQAHRARAALLSAHMARAASGGFGGEGGGGSEAGAPTAADPTDAEPRGTEEDEAGGEDEWGEAGGSHDSGGGGGGGGEAGTGCKRPASGVPDGGSAPGKRFKRVAAAARSLPPLPPLRPYQRDVVGMVLASWGVPLTQELLAPTAAAAAAAAEGGGAGSGREGGGGAAAEHSPDAHARALRKAGGWSRNWLVCAPTSSGKTRMLIEVARGVVGSKPAGRGAVVVVVVPAVILTQQHAAHAAQCALPHTQVGAYSSANPLTAAAWADAVRAAGGAAGGQSSVLVCTAGTFLNVLQTGGASLAQADLLVLDEAHHCKDDHPYAQLMALYDPGQHSGNGGGGGAGEAQQHGGAGPMPRVLALTATLATDSSPAALASRVEALKRRLGARLEVVHEDDPHVAAVLPEARQLEARVGMRPIDAHCVMLLRGYALVSALALAESMSESRAEGAAEAARQSLLQALEMHLVSAASLAAPDAAGPVSWQWLGPARDAASAHGWRRLDAVCHWLSLVLKAVELVEDGGFEGALLFLARKAVALCAQEEEEAQLGGAAGAGGAAALAAPPGVSPQRASLRTTPLEAPAACPAPSGLRGLMFRAAAAALASPEAVPAVAAPAGGAADAGDGGSDQPLDALPPPPLLTSIMLTQLRTAAAAAAPGRAGPSPSSATAQVPPVGGQTDEAGGAAEAAATMGATADAAADADAAASSGRRGDVSLQASALIRGLLVGDADGEVRFMAAPEVAARVRSCFCSGELDPDTLFPKLRALVRYLQGYLGRECFHGIVFVKTRQAVLYVSDMLRRCQQLASIEVLELVGHSLSRKRNGMGQAERHGRGMDDAAQLQVVQAFKRPGRKVLVATAAAEEGLDVPSCEFVVRYNAAASGIQLLQSRGRARQKAAEFLAILQDGTLDAQLHAKSVEEEANMRSYQRSAKAGT